MQHILFISHDANRAGSQLLLLELIRLLGESGVKTHLLVQEGGNLLDDFRKVTEVTLLDEGASSPPRIISRIPGARRLQTQAQRRSADRVLSGLLALDFDLLFVNSVANAGFYRDRLSSFHHLPVVLFAHELAMSVGMYTERDQLEFLLCRCQHLITVSRAVADYYAREFGFPTERSSTFTLINTADILARLSKTAPDFLRQKLNLPADALVVGGCGNAEWRKGNDIFNLIARNVIARMADRLVYFVWIGAGESHPFFELIRFDIERFGLSDQILLLPPTDEALECMSGFDLFLLSSREDPYPLVVLEAALLQKPVVCFAESGGAPELVEADAGRVVDYLDVEGAAVAVAELLLDGPLRKRMGEAAREKVLTRHDTAESVARLLAIIESATSSKSTEESTLS